MDKLAAVIAIAALGVAGYALTQAGAKDTQIEALQTANQELKDRMVTLEAEAGTLGGAPAALREAGGNTVLGHASDGTPVGLKGRPASPIDRLAALEKRVAEQDEALAKMESEKSTEAAALGTAGKALRGWSRDNFYGNLDMAAKSLELNDSQKTDMQDVLDRANRELEDLYAIENDEGVTWKEVRKPKMVEGNGFSIAVPDFHKISASSRRAASPAAARPSVRPRQRIRKDAFATYAQACSRPSRRSKWDKAHKDAMLGSGGGSAAVDPRSRSSAWARTTSATAATVRRPPP